MTNLKQKKNSPGSLEKVVDIFASGKKDIKESFPLETESMKEVEWAASYWPYRNSYKDGEK